VLSTCRFEFRYRNAHGARLHDPPPSTQKRAQCGWLGIAKARAIGGREGSPMPAFGLLFVIFGVLGVVSVKKGRSVLPGGLLHQLPEAAYVVMITFGAAWTVAMTLGLFL